MGHFSQQGLTLIPSWISNHIHYNVLDEITYSFLNLNFAAVEFLEWIDNFISHILINVITYFDICNYLSIDLICFTALRWGRRGDCRVDNGVP